MKKRIIRLPQTDNYRIIAISDIHGHLALFEALFERLSLKDEDILIIIGDFINKGPDSLGTLRRMMALEERPNTYILKGNHEFFLCHYLLGDGQGDHFLDYLKKDYFSTLCHETAKQGGFDLYACSDMKDFIRWSMAHYGEEYRYIHTLPAILFVDDLTFVHGGYSKDIDVTTEEGRLLKFDDFDRLGDVQDGQVIVGHWPAANLRQNKDTNKPYFNKDKNIISIDGGVGVKASGELNALIIEKQGGQRHFHYLQENHFHKTAVVKGHLFKEEDKIFVNYPHFDIELIEKGPVMSLCRHVQSGKALSIFNTLLETVGGKTQVITTYINHFLNLPVGEMVEVVMVYEDCVLVKHDGEFGWLLAEQIDAQSLSSFPFQ